MIAKITIEDNNLIIIESKPANLKLIGDHFTYMDTSECWVRGKYKKEKAKRVPYLIRAPKVTTMALLPIGFLQDLERFLIKNEARYKIFDERNVKTPDVTHDEIKNSLGYLELFDFQADAVRACLDNPSGIVKAPTGAGKTEIFISLCKILNEKTLILFSRVDLAKQTKRRMEAAGLDAGIVQGKNIDESHQIVMCTIQSSHKLRDTDYKKVIVDECHRTNSQQYQDLLSNRGFERRYGFSATPYVKDKYKNARTKAWLGDIIYEIPATELMEIKRIARPHIKVLPITFPDDIFDVKSWPEIERLGIVENMYRNKIISRLVSQLEGQTLVLVVKIAQGDHLNRMIPDSYFLSGETKVEVRQEAIERFDAGEPITLIASTIFDEGIDIKNVNNVIICGGGASFVKVLQRLGRGLRTTETKHEVDIYDFNDKTHKTLTKHSDTRMKTYVREGFDDVVQLSKMELKNLLGL